VGVHDHESYNGIDWNLLPTFFLQFSFFFTIITLSGLLWLFLLRSLMIFSWHLPSDTFETLLYVAGLSIGLGEEVLL